jgi:hypothetical protein
LTLEIFKIIPVCRAWPTIALEVGYSESYEDLVEDARLLLEGTRGEIGLVFLIKVDPLKPEETRIQNGFFAIWIYDFEEK